MALFKENPEQAKQKDVFNALQTIEWASEEAKARIGNEGAILPPRQVLQSHEKI